MTESKKLGLVLPTLGVRSAYLLEALRSIHTNQNIHVCIVAPKGKIADWMLESELIDQVTIDMGLGLAAAINAGIKSLPEYLEFVSWLGDDDTLIPGSLDSIGDFFAPGVVAIYGDCHFIDENSEVFWTLRTNQRAIKTLSWGPNRIPQPGSILRRSALKKIGYLDENLSWAFDQDMFLRLRSVGHIRYVRRTFANFRWHPNSLSSGGRAQSLLEASKVRLMHTPKALYFPALLREWLHVKLAQAITPSIDRKLRG